MQLVTVWDGLIRHVSYICIFGGRIVPEKSCHSDEKEEDHNCNYSWQLIGPLWKYLCRFPYPPRNLFQVAHPLNEI